MAELERQDIISDKAIEAPLILTKNLQSVVDALDQIISKAKQSEAGISAATSTAKLSQETKKLTESQSALLKVQKDIANSEVKLNQSYSEEAKIKARLSVQQQERNKQLKQEAREALGLTTAYDKLAKELADAIRKYKDLAAAGNTSSKVLKDQERVVQQLNTKVRTIDATVGQFQRNVGNYPKTFVAAGNALTSFLGAFGIVQGVQLFANAISGAIKINREFEKSISELSAITGATGKDLEFYKEQAAQIGATTTLSSKQAVEAFKLIGSARPELLKAKESLVEVTREAVTLAEASGLTLPEAADALAGALNQLQLPSSKASDVINSLAAGSQAGAAEIPAINEALQKFGSVAKTANVSIEETVGLIETLADRQLKGAEAGTALRNVLLRVSAVETLPKDAKTALAKYNVDLKKVSDTTVPLNERLREFGKIGGDLNAIVDVFGKENAVAGQILLNNIGRFEELTAAVTDTTIAYDQQRTATDNLDGDIKAFQSTVEGLVLGVGEKTEGVLRSIVQTATFFVSVIKEIPGFIIENKTAFLALGAAIIGLKLPLILSASLTLKDVAAKKLMVLWNRAATLSTTQLFTVLAANPFGLVIAGIAGMVAILAVLDKNTKRSNEVAEKTVDLNQRLDEAIEKVVRTRQELTISIDDFLKLSQDEQRDLRVQIALRKNQALAILEEVEARRDSLRESAKGITFVEGLKKIFTDLIDTEEESTNRIKDWSKAHQDAATGDIDARIEQLKKEIEDYNNFLTNSNKAATDDAAKNDKEQKDSFFDLQKFRIEQAIKTQQEIAAREDLFIESRKSAVVEAERLQRQLAKLERDKDLEDAGKNAIKKQLIEEKYQAQLKEIRKTGQKTREEIEKGGVDTDRRLAESILQNRININEQLIAEEKSSFEDRNKAALQLYADRQGLLDLQYQREQEAAKGNFTELIRLQKEYNAASDKLSKESSDAIAKNVVTQFDRITQSAADSNQDQIRILNQQFKDGEISFDEFQKRRIEIQKRGQDKLFSDQISFLEQEIQILKEQGIDVAKFERKLWELRNEEAQLGADNRIEIEERMKDALIQLQQQIFQSIGEITSNFSAAEDARLQNQLDKLQAQRDRDLELAGDNADAKLAIEQEFTQKSEQIQKQQAANRKKQAILEKGIAAFQIGVNTAQAIIAALAPPPVGLGPVAGIPLGVVIGAIGALQLAAVLSKPVPTFAEGGIAPGGPIIAGEIGTEMMFFPSGKIGFTPSRATVMDDVPRGTQIVPHDETMRMLALSGLQASDMDRMPNESMLSRLMLKKMDILNATMKSTKQPVIDLVRQGSVLLEARQETSTFKKYIRSLSMGRWYS